MAKQYTALGNNVFIKEIKEDRKIGLLSIPSDNSIDFKYGFVVSVGEGLWEHGHFTPPNVSIGDEVVFPATIGQKINFNGLDLILVSADTITGKLTDKEVMIESIDVNTELKKTVKAN